MKNIFFICMFGLLAFAGCSDNEEEILTGGNIDIDMLPPNQPNDVIDEKLFAVINLDYPGLEKAKEFYNSGKYYYAVNELLEYYRNRTSVINPNIQLMNTPITASELNIADQALENRFYVRGFAERVEDGKEIYYSFTKDNKIDWSFIPSKVTDQEFKYQIHRHQWMLPQAKAYRTSRDEKYAESWINVYSDWLKTFPYEEGTTFPEEGGKENDVDYQWKGLQVAERVISQIDIMTYFIQSKNFTPEWLSVFLTAFAKEVECIRLNYYKEGNILVTQAQAVAMAGILMPEFKNANEWLSEGSQKLGEQIDKQFLADGVHYEFDISYHVGAISDFYETYRVAQLNNKAGGFPAGYLEKLKLPAHFVMDITYPNYSVENFNDTRSSRLGKSVLIKNFKKYAEMFPDDQEIQWMASERQSGSTPTYLQKAYTNGGYYILRNKWDDQSMMMILKNNNNPNNKYHCQPDNATFSLYKKGRNFFPDAGSYAYSGSDRETYRGTARHNTLTIMSKTIPDDSMKGKLLQLTTKTDEATSYDVLVTENPTYTVSGEKHLNLTHRRSVFFVNQKFFVIVDEGYDTTADHNSNINVNFHLCPIENASSDVVIDEGQKDSHIYGAHTAFSDNNNIMLRTFVETANDYSASVKTTNTSNDIGQKTERKGYQVTIRKPKIVNGAARFISIIYPINDGAEAANINMTATFTDIADDEAAGTFHANGTSVKVIIDNKEYNLSYTLN